MHEAVSAPCAERGGKPILSGSILAVSLAGMPAILADFDWSQYTRVLDIGGAYGSMLAALMQAYPAARGVLFDLPQVIDRAQKVRCDPTAWCHVTGCAATRSQDIILLL